MRDGWREVRLGEVLALDVEPVIVRPDTQYQLAGVYSFGRGLFRRDPLLGAGTSYQQLHRLRKGQLVLSKLKAWEGAVAVVGEGFDGFVLSPEFPTFSITGPLEPGYLSLLCEQADFWERLRLESRGVGGRRERVHPRRLLDIAIRIPTLAQQGRIISLTGSVVDVVERADALALQGREAWEALLSEVENSIAERVAVADLVRSIDAGKSPPTLDRPPRADEDAVLKVSAVGRDQFRPDQAKAMQRRHQLPEASRLHAGDLLITRASGSLERVGQVSRVETAPRNYFISDKTLRLIPREDLVTPTWLKLALLAPGSRRQIEAVATGSDMRNISQAAIRSVRVALPELADQVSLGEACEAMASMARASSALANSGRYLRTQLDAALLSGNHEIPDSYDALLEPAS
jgi:type I restriction enzyme S subunit